MHSSSYQRLWTLAQTPSILSGYLVYQTERDTPAMISNDPPPSPFFYREQMTQKLIKKSQTTNSWSSANAQSARSQPSNRWFSSTPWPTLVDINLPTDNTFSQYSYNLCYSPYANGNTGRPPWKSHFVENAVTSCRAITTRNGDPSVTARRERDQLARF